MKEDIIYKIMGTLLYLLLVMPRLICKLGVNLLLQKLNFRGKDQILICISQQLVNKTNFMANLKAPMY